MNLFKRSILFKRGILFLLIALFLVSGFAVSAEELWTPVFQRDNGFLGDPDPFWNFEKDHGKNLDYVRNTLINQVKSSHPRIFLTGADDISNIWSRINSDADVAGRAYGKAKAWADSVSSLSSNLEVYSTQLETLALVYLMEKGNPLSTQEYTSGLLNKIKGILNKFLSNYTTIWASTFERAYLSRSMAITYDWLYNDLDTTLLNSIANASLFFAQKTYAGWPHSDYNNHIYIQYYNLLYAALAMKDEDVNNTAANEIFIDVAEMIKFHGIPAHNQTGAGEKGKKGDGGWPESISYMAESSCYFAQAVEALQAATGDKLWKDLYGLDGDADYYYHTTVPYTGQQAMIDNTHPTPLGKKQFLYMPLLASRRSSESAAGMLMYLMKGFDSTRPKDVDTAYAYNLVPTILWYDASDVNAIPKEELDTSKCFNGLGIVTMRSSWLQDATFAVFQSQPYYAGHQHFDANSFMIAREGNLAMDRAGNIKDSKYHSTVQIGNGQRTFSEDPIYMFKPIYKEDVRSYGKIELYESDKQYTYAIGDATEAYDSSIGVEDYTRHFIYLNPDTFIIYDRIKTVSSDTAKEWRLQTVSPAISLDNSNFSITDGMGQLHVQSLLPANTVASVKTEGGHNMISVTSSESNCETYFLNVLTTGKSGAASPTAATVVEESNGLKVSLTRNNVDYTIVFHKNPNHKARIKYSR